MAIAAPARQQVGVEGTVDQVAVPDEVDPLDARRAVGDTGAGEERVDGTTALVDSGVDALPVAQIEVDRP